MEVDLEHLKLTVVQVEDTSFEEGDSQLVNLLNMTEGDKRKKKI